MHSDQKDSSLSQNLNSYIKDTTSSTFQLKKSSPRKNGKN